jgi:AraC-like DNA-binding protein
LESDQNCFLVLIIQGGASMLASDFHNSTSELDDDPVDIRERQLRETAAGLKIRPEDLDVFVRSGVPIESIPKHPQMRRSMLAYLRKKETPPPNWVMISGIWPEVALDAGERRKRVRALYKATVLLIRRELKRHEVDAFRAERSIFWDPVVEVCRALEISQSKLSAFCKELTGNSLIQVVDSIRAEGVKTTLRAGIRKFVKGFLVSGLGVSGTGGSEKNAHDACLGTEKVDRWGVWEGLKASRKWPEFSQNSWAQELGFASYRRLYRACQVVYGMTPHQMEMELIGECLAEGGTTGGEEGNAEAAKDGGGPSLEEIEGLVRGIGAYELFE